jgi:hypothetical protein
MNQMAITVRIVTWTCGARLRMRMESHSMMVDAIIIPDLTIASQRKST